MELRITAVQSDLYWEDIDQNLEMFTNKITAIKELTDIIVLPEMFNTGFSMNSKKLAETMNGKTVSWMKEISKRSNAVVVGSLIIEEEEQYFNRLIWMQPDGECFTYDKRHLFRMAEEHEHFSAGNKRLIVDYKGWKICPLVCYDLRFPVWSRNITQDKTPVYDCLIYIANWPAVRKRPWSKLLEARAIENQCYVVGINRVGIDGTSKEYSGNSAIINPKGEVISSIAENEECSETICLSLKELDDFRKTFPVSLDGDRFEIIL